MKTPNFYASGGIDRAAHLRSDEQWIKAQIDDQVARVVPVWRSQNLVRPGDPPGGVAVDASRGLLMGAGSVVFLGLIEEVAHFAADFSAYDEPPLEEHGQFRDMRGVGQLLSHQEGALLVYARATIQWHARHQFCGVCGNATISQDSGHMRKCTNADCATQHFPRLDPAVIMLIHDGGDRLILGRQKNWPPGQHSVLAGFVEPGESLEDAVAREIFEEVGVEITDIHYHSSQPWPFPSSIMLGYTARTSDTTLNVARDELEDARWFTRDELLNSPENDSFRLPRRDSISRRLIDDWMNA
ncbi:MAG: NAD(+) diphosphatase [Alphaproteobacteria bacterium]|nr:NAD(+) diphosphatase [Alphaproteobacteria bacterium]